MPRLPELLVQPVLLLVPMQAIKKAFCDSHDNFESGAKADAAQVNHNTDGQANTYNNFAADNQQKFADERFGSNDDNGSAAYNTPPRAGKKFFESWRRPGPAV